MFKRFMAVCVAAMLVVSGILAAPATAATSSYGPAPITAVLGDSIPGGEGNSPYLPGTDTTTDSCHRSSRAYGPLLAQFGVISLPAASFVACSGATPADLLSVYKTEQPQINALSAQTQLAILQFGANPVFGQAAALCIIGDCSNDPRIALLIAQIQQVLPGQLNAVYADVRSHAPKAKVIVNLYDNPFAAPGAATTYCPYMNQAELGVAWQFLAVLNGVITTAAHQAGFSVADANPFTTELNICTRPPGYSAFFPVDPAVPQTAWLHLNQLGQLINASVLAMKIYR